MYLKHCEWFWNVYAAKMTLIFQAKFLQTSNYTNISQ